MIVNNDSLEAIGDTLLEITNWARATGYNNLVDLEEILTRVQAIEDRLIKLRKTLLEKLEVCNGV